MTGLLIRVLLTWIATLWLGGFGWVSVASLISSLMFCGRKIGYFCKLTHLLVIEGIGFFLMFVWESVFNKVIDWKQLILIFLVRCIFILICWFDMTQWVYVREERRKDNSRV